jgi:hypothetical protein
VRRFTLRFRDLPPEFEGYRIVFAADFHVYRERPIHRKALGALARLDGDILVLGGDFQSMRSHSNAGAIQYIKELEPLAPRFPDGIVAVRGNHDDNKVRDYLKQDPAIRLLYATSYLVRRGDAEIAFTGVYKPPDNPDTHMSSETQRAAAGVPDSVRFRVLVAHWPVYFLAAKGQYDLVLCGDTHGGQIRLPLIGPVAKKTKLPRRFAWGLVEEGGSTLYTTSGVGTQFVPLRLLCPPEIVVFTLQKETRPSPTAAGK